MMRIGVLAVQGDFIEHEKRGELVDAKIEGRIVVESEK